MPYRPVPPPRPRPGGPPRCGRGASWRCAGSVPPPGTGGPRRSPAACRIRVGRIRVGPRPRRRAHRRRVRRRLAHRPRPARTRRPRGVPPRCGPRRPPGRPGGPPAAGQPAPGRARRPARRAGRAGASGAAQLRPLLVRGLPAAVDGPCGGAGPDGPARDGHGAAVRGARAGSRLSSRRCRTAATGTSPGCGSSSPSGATAGPPGSPPWSNGCARSRCSAGSWPTGRRSASSAGGRRRPGRLPDAGRAAARGRPGLPGRRPRPDRLAGSRSRSSARPRSCRRARPGSPRAPARCCVPAFPSFTPDGWAATLGDPIPVPANGGRGRRRTGDAGARRRAGHARRDGPTGLAHAAAAVDRRPRGGR